jgi:hypothetical protein
MLIENQEALAWPAKASKWSISHQDVSLVLWGCGRA